MSANLFSDIRLVAPDDPGFRAFVRRIRAQRACIDSLRPTPTECVVVTPHLPPASQEAPAPVALRFAQTESSPQHGSISPPSPSPGMIGRQVERAVRQWLGMYVKLERDCILTWRRRDASLEGWERRYAELDAVHRVDYDTLLVCEIKFTNEARMRLRAGQSQLDRAASLLEQTRTGRRVLRRLVYVGEGDLHVPGVSAIPPEDTETPEGVLWVSPREVARIAAANACPLPACWLAGRPSESPLSAMPENAFRMAA